MKPATLYCPRQKVLTENGFSFDPVIPGPTTPISGSMLEIDVNVLQVEDDRATVLLPEILRKGEQYTAIVGIQHLS